MGIESRISRRPGETFVKVQRWAVEAVGFSAAAVLGQLDFIDAGQQFPGAPLATRARLIADLEGIVGQRAIDESLKKLAELGWIGVAVESVHHERNITQVNRYQLFADAVNDWRDGEKRQVTACLETKLQNRKSRDCKTASKNATPVYTRFTSLKEVEEPAASPIFQIGSPTHPKTAEALCQLAVRNHAEWPDQSNQVRSEKSIRAALGAAKLLTDEMAAGIVAELAAGGGWVSKARVALQEAGDAAERAKKETAEREKEQKTRAHAHAGRADQLADLYASIGRTG